jgi:hypothetical protein
MSCMTLFLHPAAMATTQLVECARYNVPTAEPVVQMAERKQALRMSWVVVTGNGGKRQLRMQWSVRD